MPDSLDSTAGPSTPAIELQGASLTYPNGTIALAATDLRIESGQFVSLLGPSGCGKSTLLKMMSGLLAPSGGHVHTAAGPESLSYVFQDATLMPWADVWHNVRLPLDLAGTPKSQANERVHEALKLVGLDGFARHKPHQLSGGMQMRASIARGLVTRPKLLLMDEPFGALDEITRHKLDSDLHRLWLREPELTVVFVTHSVAEAVYLSQRVIVMGTKPGRIVADLIIDEPYPREVDVRTSAAFNEQVRTLHHLLNEP